MFELLVPPEPAQLQRLGGDKKAYDLSLRPALMVQAIHELQDAGVEADVWKIEGLDRQEDCRPDHLLAAAGRIPRQKITREAAVAQIAGSYRAWVDLFEKAK